MARPTGSWCRSGRLVARVLSQGDAWGCPSILVSSPCLAFVVIYNSNDPLAASVNMDVLDFDRLAVPLPAPIEDLEQVALKLEEPVGITSIDRDVLFAQVALAQLHHAERGEASDDELHAHQSFNLAFMIGDSESEIEMADRAVALNPNSHIAWQNRGWVYKIAGLQEEAIRRFERAIRMSPVDPLLHPAFIGIGIFNHLIRL